MGLWNGFPLFQPNVSLWIYPEVSVHTEPMGESLWILDDSGRGKGVVEESGRFVKAADRPDQ